MSGEQAAFRGRIRLWDEASGRGLAVIDIPAGLVAPLGGRRQYRVTATVSGTPFTASTMLVAGGGFCVSISRATLATAGAAIGDEVEVTLERA
jgi:uncharacterized protein DUF1905